ncbi:MAG: hypothetical protein HZA54_19600, partial [Planctomycetes bacterium]|nr:hypothetical protein [Planctomycetota bacterium]
MGSTSGVQQESATVPVTVKCSCGQRLVVPDSVVGKRGKCPKCGRVLALDLDNDGQEVGEGGAEAVGLHAQRAA